MKTKTKKLPNIKPRVALPIRCKSYGYLDLPYTPFNHQQLALAIKHWKKITNKKMFVKIEWGFSSCHLDKPVVSLFSSNFLILFHELQHRVQVGRGQKVGIEHLGFKIYVAGDTERYSREYCTIPCERDAQREALKNYKIFRKNYYQHSFFSNQPKFLNHK